MKRLGDEARRSRAPLPPEELVDAKCDRVHRDPGRARAARTGRPHRAGVTRETDRMTSPPTHLATDLIAKVDAAESRSAVGPLRGHLGASQIGRSCAREIWYSWRWSSRVSHPPRILRLFRRGHREEPEVARQLRAAGCDVITGGADGDQIRLAHPDHGGHVSGSCDGLVHGAPGIDGWAILEIKTISAKGHKKLTKEGVRVAKPEHWTQMQIYMQWADLRFALYWSVCKDNDEIHAEIVERDDDAADDIEDRIREIFESQTPPPRGYDAPSTPPCSWCDHRSVCWSAQPVPVPTCRTCTRAIVSLEGGSTWRCGRDGTRLTPAQQYAGCNRRLPVIQGWTA